MNKRTLRSFIAGYNKNCNAAVLTPALGKQLRIHSVKLLNKSGGTIDLGVLRRFGPSGYKLWELLAGVVTDITSLVQGAASTELISVTNNDGFIVQSAERFGLIGFTVSQAEAGSPVYTYQYWDGAAWQTLSTIAVPTAYDTSKEQLVLFAAPANWAVGGNAATGLDSTKFSIRMKATTAPSTAVKVSDVWVAQLLDFQYQVANNLSWEWKVAVPELPMEFQAQDGVLPYFSGTANAANQISCQYVVQD